MRNLNETPAAEIDIDSYQKESLFLNARDVAESHANLVALYSHKAKTQEYGVKHFLHVKIEGDPTDTEYTLSFTDRSPAYAQLEKLAEVEAEGQAMNPDYRVYPIRCRVKQVGKSFGLEAASEEETKLGESWLPPVQVQSQHSPF